MSRMDWLKRVNPVLFLAFLVQAVTGAAYYLAGGEVLEGIHLTGGLLMFLAAGIHLALNWGWVKANYFKQRNPTDKG